MLHGNSKKVGDNGNGFKFKAGDWVQADIEDKDTTVTVMVRITKVNGENVTYISDVYGHQAHVPSKNIYPQSRACNELEGRLPHTWRTVDVMNNNHGLDIH